MVRKDNQRRGRNPHSRVSMQKKKQKKSRFWLWCIFAVIILAASGAAGMWFTSSSLFQKKAHLPNFTNRNKQEELIYAQDKAVVLIMGVDERHELEQDVGRSDTLMVAMLDPDKNQASLLSVPRDTRVRIKGLGWDKINAAYSFGGEKLTISTVEKFLATRMDHYVIVNTHNFPRIIDAIGGVDIDVEMRMEYDDPWDDNGGLHIDLYPGPQHMDGKTAITYVRYRDEEGDIGRVRRQQKFMKACMEKVTSPAIIPRLPSIIREVMGSIETDLSFRQILELAGSLKKAQSNGLKTSYIDGKAAEIDGIIYWIPDISDVRETVARALDVRMSSSVRRNMEQEEAEYEASLPPNTIFDDEKENERRGLGRGYSTGRDDDEDTRPTRRRFKDKTGKFGSTLNLPTPATKDEDDEKETRGRDSDGEEKSGSVSGRSSVGRPTPSGPSRPVSPQAGGKRQN